MPDARGAVEPKQPIFFQSDREGHWLHVDMAWQVLTHTTTETWPKAIHQSDQARIRSAWQQAVQQRQPFRCTYRLVDGHTHIEHWASPTESGFIGSLAITTLHHADLIDLMFNQALDGFFLMLLDEPLAWHDGIDKEAALDYVFAHQRMTRVNQAMLDQYGAQEADFLGKTPAELFAHDLAQGRDQWRQLFDHGHIRTDTYEQNFDGRSMIIEGDYTCLYDEQGQILWHFGTQRDVTQQRGLEQALAAQKRLLERIMEATPNGVYIYDLQTHCNSYINPRVSEILGYTSAEISAQGSTVLSRNIHPDDWPRVEVHLSNCRQLCDGQVATIEYRFRHAKGHWCWIQSRDVVFSRNPDGSASQILGVLQDVSNRKELEQQLNENLSRFEQLTRNVPALVYRIAIDAADNKRMLYLSPRAEEMFGLSTPEILEDFDRLWALINPTDAQHMLDMATENKQGEGAPLLVQFRLTTPSGTQKWFEAKATPTYSSDGSTIWDGVMLDITERKTAEQQLNDSLRRFEQLTQNVPVLVYRYEVDAAGHKAFTYLSQRAEDLFGVPIEACLADANLFWNAIVPEDVEQMAASCAQAQAEGIPWQSQFRLTTPAGVQKWLEGNSVFSERADGGVISDGVMLDITERKQLELSLQQQILREQAQNRITRAIRETLDLETIFATATREVAKLWPLYQVGIMRYCQDFWQVQFDYCVDSNRPSAKGYQVPDRDNPIAVRVKNQELICVSDDSPADDPINVAVRADFPGTWLIVPLVVEGKVWGSYNLIVNEPRFCWQPEDITLVEAIADQLAIAIQQVELYEQLKQLNTDLEIEVEQRTAELQTSLNLADIQADITEQVRSSLNEELILQTVVNALGIELNLSYCNVCLYFNNEPQVCFTYSDNTAYKDTLILSPIDFPSLYSTLHQGQSAYLSLQIDQDWFTAFLVPVCDEQAVLGDILVLRQREAPFLAMEMQLVQQVAAQCAIALRQSRLYQAAQEQVIELQRLNQLKGDFLSTVSHELRTPMTSIKLAIQMLEARLKPLDLPPTIQTYLKILNDESNREIRLINDLLDMAKLEAGTIDLSPSEVDCRQLIERLLHAQSLRTQAQQQTVAFDASTEPIRITTDAVLLERIFAELIHNAVKYTPAQEAITVHLSVHNDQLAVAIRNTGVSLPRRELSLIFDKFYRLTDTDRWKHGGTGLGLALVKQMVSALGGSIWANSDETSTTFNLRLPLNLETQAKTSKNPPD